MQWKNICPNITFGPLKIGGDSGTGVQCPFFFLHLMISMIRMIIIRTMAAMTPIQMNCIHSISCSFSIKWVNWIGFPRSVSTIQVTFPTSSWVKLNIVMESFLCLKYLQEYEGSKIHLPLRSNPSTTSLHVLLASSDSSDMLFELCRHCTVLLRSRRDEKV